MFVLCPKKFEGEKIKNFHFKNIFVENKWKIKPGY